MHRVRLFFLLALLPLGLFAASNDDLSKSKETDQSTVASLLPPPAKSGVSPDSDIKAAFTVPLDEKQVKSNVVRLTKLDGQQKAIAGNVSYLADSKLLRFTPATFLEPGIYEVDIDAIKATKDYQQEQIKNIMYRFEVADVRVQALKVSPEPVEVDVNKSVQLQAIAVYSDGGEKPVAGKASWSSADKTIITVSADGEALGLSEGNTTISASYKGMASVPTTALVYLEIAGHRLPFEPDPAVNNSTLLGIDSNNNGIRDDVERQIYENYKDKHPVYIDVGLQAAKAWQEILKNPKNAKETSISLHAAIDCEAYYANHAKYFNEPILIHEKVTTGDVKNMMLNTKERNDAFWEYDSYLTGSVSTVPWPSEAKQYCDFNTSY